MDHRPGVHAIPRTCRLWFRTEYVSQYTERSRISDVPTASPPQEHIQGGQWFTDYQVDEQWIYQYIIREHLFGSRYPTTSSPSGGTENSSRTWSILATPQAFRSLQTPSSIIWRE